MKSLKVERTNNKKEITVQPFNHSTVKLRQQCAFTLAEVLITIGIIGVVAVLTIPSLVSYNQEKGWNTAATVFEAKLNEALNVMNTQQVLAGYKTTEDFVNEFSRHMKITKICQNDDILSCFEDKVQWGNKEIKIPTIKTADKFGYSEWGTNVLGLQFANGTNALLAYNPKCEQDPYNNQFVGSSCISMLYDTSGYANPNENGKDLRGLNVLKLGFQPAFEIDGLEFSMPLGSVYASSAECEEIKKDISDYYIDCKSDSRNRFVTGVKTCKEFGGHVASRKEVEKVLSKIYPMETMIYNVPENDGWTDYSYTCPDDTKCRDGEKAGIYGLGANYANIMTSENYMPKGTNTKSQYTLLTTPTGIKSSHDAQGSGAGYAIFCVGD